MLIQEMLFNYSIAFKSQMHRETQVSLDIQTRPNLKTLSVLNYESERSPVFFLKKENSIIQQADPQHSLWRRRRSREMPDCSCEDQKPEMTWT